MKKKMIILIMISAAILCGNNRKEIEYDKNNIDVIKDGIKNRDVYFWNGWKDYHFGVPDPITIKGGLINYKTNVNGDIREYTIKSTGYGYYSFDFKRHIVGLLSFLKKDGISNYQTNYIPKNSKILYNEEGIRIEPSMVKMEDGIDITIEKILTSWYSEKYEETEFKEFWNGSFLSNHAEELKEKQNRFFWQVYGKNAYEKLNNMTKGKYNDKEAILVGVLLSIMEARYSHKDLQNKNDLTIKVEEGDLLPFLVYLGNWEYIEREEIGDKKYRYIDRRMNQEHYEFPDFNKLIEGVYLWMYYYEQDVIKGTNYNTITSNKDKEEEIEKYVDWDGEYRKLTGNQIRELDYYELEEFYNRCNKIKSTFKKSKENDEGIFGLEELYDITSEDNYSEVLSNMKDKMEEFFVGAELNEVWSGLTDYNIERTYLMAKNIVSANKIQNEYAYYDIGTNILTHTPGIDGDEYMLIDFQKVKLVKPLKYYHDVYKKRVFSDEDTDDDGIYDVIEMGDDDGMKQKVDITGFVRKMVENELYGNDKEAINNNQQIINKVVANIKYNIYENRTEFREQNLDNNKVDINDIYEHQLTVDENTLNNLKKMSNAEKREDYLNFAPSKLEVELWRYKSNPVLKDTDFDGLEDGFGYEIKNGIDVPVALNIPYDKRPKDNYFTGRMHTTRMTGNDAIEVDMNMDYRYFFMSNKMYYDELSTMSLLYANSIYRKGSGQSMHSGLQLRSANNLININNGKLLYSKEEIDNISIDSFNNLQVKEMMEHFGFENVITYYMGERGDGTDNDPADGSDVCRGYKDTHKGRVAIGYKNIEYHGLDKTVIGIVIRGTAEDDDWDSDFDMGDKELRDKINEYEIGTFNKTKVGNGFNNKDKNIEVINAFLNSSENKKYDHKYNTELAHFAYGYPDWIWDYHHAGFDIVSNRILEVLNEYITAYDSNFENDICFWVTGHSMGGGVANLVAASLVYGECGGNADNVYCYTFAAPNTFYLTDNKYERDNRGIEGKKITSNYREPHGVKYRCIFNIVNEDDFVPKLPMEECAWTKYGRVSGKSFWKTFWTNQSKLNISITLEPNYGPQIQGNYNLYKFATKYCGNSDNPGEISKAFSNIFNNKENMRSEAYTFNNDFSLDLTKYSNEPSKEVFRWAMPFQKLEYLGSETITRNFKFDGAHISQPLTRTEYKFEQKLSPQYLFTSVGEMMHEYSDYVNDDGKRNKVDNKLDFFTMRLPKKFHYARKSFFSFVPLNLRGLYIEHPHYIESYFTLTKIINTIDFK